MSSSTCPTTPVLLMVHTSSQNACRCGPMSTLYHMSASSVPRCMRTMSAIDRCAILLTKDSTFFTTAFCRDGSHPRIASTSGYRMSMCSAALWMPGNVLQPDIGKFFAMLLNAAEWCGSPASSMRFSPCRPLVGCERGTARHLQAPHQGQ